jgi:FdhD protein
MEQAASAITYLHYQSGSWESVGARVIAEAPVTLSVNGLEWLTFMCMPVDLEAMAVGFLFNEKLISSRLEIASTYVCASRTNVDVWTHHRIEKPSMWRRTSGCTGGATAQGEPALARQPAAPPTFPDGDFVSIATLLALLDRLFKSQELYREVRGVHSSALSDGAGVWIAAEDIGRHNTLDKIAGRMLLEDIWPQRRILLTTGRISSEMLQKSGRIGASIVLSRTSPSSLSIRLAQEAGITLIGYARRDQLNLYTCPERIVPSPVETSVPYPAWGANSTTGRA